MTLPTHEEVLAFVDEHEPCTVMDVVSGLDVDWSSRQTVRNRLFDLYWRGELIHDEGRPVRFAIDERARWRHSTAAGS